MTRIGIDLGVRGAGIHCTGTLSSGVCPPDGPAHPTPPALPHTQAWRRTSSSRSASCPADPPHMSPSDPAFLERVKGQVLIPAW